MGRIIKRILGAGLTILLLVVLAGFGIVYVQGRSRPAGSPFYVALGSSYASGPGLAPRSPGSPFLCGRSDGNYAHILARKRKLALVDVTCAGATTEHVLRGSQYFQSAQVDAVSADTRLVTMTIGGNDVSYLGNLSALSCDGRPSLLGLVSGGCEPVADAKVEKAFAGLRAKLEAISAEVHRRAPRARILFVNYLTVLPPTGTCSRLGLTVADADRMRTIAARLAAVTKDAARASDAGLVDLATLSRDHGVCATAPWLNARHPTGALTAPLHPNTAGMHAAAAAIDASLSRR